VLKKDRKDLNTRVNEKEQRKDTGKHRQRGGWRLVKRGDEEEFEGGRNG
jgi:hypothetical protein